MTGRQTLPAWMTPVPLSDAERRIMRQWRNTIDAGGLCRGCGRHWGPDREHGWALHHAKACMLMVLEARAEGQAVAS